MNLPGKAIKICFIAPKAYPLFNPDVKEVFGGAEVDLYFLATELAKDDNFAVSFVTADYGQDEFETIEAVRVIKSLDFKENPLASAIKIWQAMRKANADMYMIKTISPGMFLAALFCLFHHKTFIYRTAHETECDGTYLKRHPMLGILYKWALKTAKLVFVQNLTDKNNLERTTGVASTAIPNGHRLAKLQQLKRNTILWVGRSAPFKRPQLFIELAEKIPDEHFSFVCQRATGDEKYEQLVTQAEQVKNLEFIKRMPFNKIDSYFQRAKVLVNTSEAEGFPNTFIQACMYETPILSLNVNPDGFLDEYNCGLYADDNWDSFMKQLKMLLQTRRWKQYSKNARKYAQEHHDIKKIAQQYKKLLIQLAQNVTYD